MDQYDCPDCNALIDVRENTRDGEQVTCDECGAQWTVRVEQLGEEARSVSLERRAVDT